MAIGSPQWMYSSGEYELEQSLKLDRTRNTFLNKTFASAGNRRTFTLSFWLKMCDTSTTGYIIEGGDSDSDGNRFFLRLQSDGILRLAESVGLEFSSNALLRDPSAWYHIVIAIDTTQGTDTNRIKLYINGEIQTFLSVNYPSQNHEYGINKAAVHTIGRSHIDDNNPINAYLSEFHFIDGTAKVASDFGETGTYGEWKPKEYSGSYGTNGFYLPFKQDYTVEGFSTVTYKGTGADQYIGGVGFESDLTWIKRRNSASNHTLFDSVRGATTWLSPNLTSADDTSSYADGSAFYPDGFNPSDAGSTNASGDTYVAWNWDMGGSNATNTDGSITSTVRANPTYGQSIVSYVGNTTAGATVGHGLSSAPEMMIIKNRDRAYDWIVWHDSLADDYHLRLNGTHAALNSSTRFNSTDPSSTVFTLGSQDDTNGVSGANDDLIAYCWHSVTGYSKFGSYTGNASTDGSLSVTTGFAPAFLMVKRTNSTGGWVMVDNTRNPSNPINKYSQANTTDTEASGSLFNFTSTGFNLLANLADINSNGGTYIYMAFADKREYAYWLDQSGNNNDWTSNNLTESDISVDSPSNNFATWNPLHNGDTATFAEGNLKLTTGTSTTEGYYSTMAMPETGKWYAEFLVGYTGGWNMFGIASNVYNNSSSGFRQGTSYSYSLGQGNFWINGSSQGASSPSVSWTAGDVVSVAVDLDNNKWYIAKNNTWYQSANPSSGSNGITIVNDIYHFGYTFDHDGVSGNTTANFGQDSSFAGNKTAQGNQDGNDIGDFYYTPPTGFLALCTKNLPNVAVTPSEHFNTVLYTGDGNSTRAVTGVGFAPDFIWVKARSQAYNHVLFDKLRGVNKYIQTNTNNAETTNTGYLDSFDSDGFDTGGGGAINGNGVTFASWNWKANGSGSSNTNGTITSTVSANVDAGFSIVSYTGNGSATQTVGHGLTKAPEMLIVKRRDFAQHWIVYHASNTTAPETEALLLSATDATYDHDGYWDDTAPTSSVFTIDTFNDVNASSGTYIAYCFHSVDGYSKVGSYTGNGNADGTFVYTGFRPAFVMVKSSSATGHWQIHDTTRDVSNLSVKRLFPNYSNAEDSSGAWDILSNGFKFRTTHSSINASGASQIYIAFAETPFKYSNAR